MGDLGDSRRSAKYIHITSFVVTASRYYLSFETTVFGILYCKVVALIAEGSCIANEHKCRDAKGIGHLNESLYSAASEEKLLHARLRQPNIHVKVSLLGQRTWIVSHKVRGSAGKLAPLL